MTGPEPLRSLARPRALRPGDRLALLCVSSPVDPEPLTAGLDALRLAGLDPVLYPSVSDPGTMRPYLAGDDAARAADLRAALTDPGIAGILFARGGYGAQRTLEAMDWDGLTGLPPKVLAGYYSFASLLRTLMRPDQAMTIQYPQAVTVIAGTARGVTVGGTLSGIIAGTFSGCGPPDLIQDILAERLGPLAVPMLAWANVGHGGPFQTFPLGIAAELDAGQARPACACSTPHFS